MKKTLNQLIEQEIKACSNLINESENTSTPPLLNGKPCIGPLANRALIPIKGIIWLDWDCSPHQVILIKSLKQLKDPKYWEPNDKGSAAFYAFGGENNAILFAAVQYDGDPDAENVYERSSHYYFDTVSNLKRAW